MYQQLKDTQCWYNMSRFQSYYNAHNASVACPDYTWSRCTSYMQTSLGVASFVVTCNDMLYRHCINRLCIIAQTEKMRCTAGST